MARGGEAEASPVARRAPSEAPASPVFCLDMPHSLLSKGLSHHFVRRGNFFMNHRHHADALLVRDAQAASTPEGRAQRGRSEREERCRR